MKRIAIFSLSLALLFGLAGCSPRNTVAAIVNGVEISQAALMKEVEYELAEYKKMGYELTKEEAFTVKQAALDRLISTFLLKEAAAKLGITAATVAVDSEIEAITASFDSEDEFLQALAAADFTLESYRLALTDVMIIEALFEKELSLSEIDVDAESIQGAVDYYLENYAEEDEEIDLDDLWQTAESSLSEQRAEYLRNEYIEKLWAASEIEYFDF